MKITLISFYFMNPGVRYLSSYMKSHGHDVRIVILPPKNMYSISEEYSEGSMEDLVALCGDSGIIGFSVLTNDLFRASRVTKYLKAHTKAKIVWGGIHPSIDPESCSKEADYIYVGEGEVGLLELADRIQEGKDVSGVDNIYFWKDGAVHRNRLRPLLRGSDLSHFQDFDLENHFILESGKIVNITDEIVKINFHHDFEKDDIAYLAVFSRGCIHGCTYCCNNKLNKLYDFEKNAYRIKTPEHMIAELKYVLNKFHFIRFVYINDDNFLASNIRILSEFAGLYEKEVGLPFKALGSPVYITEEKIVALKNVGLKEIHVGVQSGSDRTNRDIYKRSIPSMSVVKTAALVHKYNLRGRYDFIFDNPYETTEDELATARLILQLPKPYILQPFSLTFFPGTELYERAKVDGILTDERSQVFEKATNEFYLSNVTYLKFVSILLSRIPYSIGKILISRPMVFIFHRKFLRGIYKNIYQGLYFMKLKLNISVKSFYKKS